MNGTNSRTWARRRRALVLRRGLAIGLIGLLPIATGCQTLRNGSESKSNPRAATTTSSASGMTTALGDKTEFHKTVRPEQQFNVHMELGRAFETEGHHEAAIAEYQKALDATGHLTAIQAGEKSPGFRQAKAHRRIGAAYDRLGRFVLAETHYRAALKASPDDPRVWNDAGYSYYLQRRWDDAERSLKTAQSIDPENFKISTNLGLALAANGKPDEALVALSKAGGPAIGHANLGYLLAALGKTEEARRHYQIAIELQPELAAARQALASLGAPKLGETLIAERVRPAQGVANALRGEAEITLTSTEAKAKAKVNELDETMPPLPPGISPVPISATAPGPQTGAPRPLAELPASSPLLEDPVPSEIPLPSTASPVATEAKVPTGASTAGDVLPGAIPEIPVATPAVTPSPLEVTGLKETRFTNPAPGLSNLKLPPNSPTPTASTSQSKLHSHPYIPSGVVGVNGPNADAVALDPLPEPVPRASAPAQPLHGVDRVVTPTRPGSNAPTLPPLNTSPAQPDANASVPLPNPNSKVIPLTVLSNP